MMTETVVTVEQGRPQNTGPPPPKPDGQQQTQDPLSWIAYNLAYFQTIPGILKLIQLVSTTDDECFLFSSLSGSSGIFEFISSFLDFFRVLSIFLDLSTAVANFAWPNFPYLASEVQNTQNL